MEIAPQLVQSLLQCVSCSKYLTPPVFSCTFGHNICSNCLKRNIYCLICSRPIHNFFSRNYIFQDLLKSTILICENPDCQCYITLYSLQEHKKFCPNSEKLACIEGCGDLHDDLLQHLISKHNYHFFQMDQENRCREFIAPLNQWKKPVFWPKAVWKFGSESFIVQAFIELQQFHLYAYRISKAKVSVRFKFVTSTGCSISFIGVPPHINQLVTQPSKAAHLSCDINSLVDSFLEVSEENLYKLTVSAKLYEINK